jgi:hypothetical protein
MNQIPIVFHMNETTNANNMLSTDNLSGKAWKVPYLAMKHSYYLGYEIGSVPPIIDRRIRRLPNWQKIFDWKENEPFFASLKFVPRTYEIGRLTLENNENGASYSITLGNLRKLLRQGNVIYGVVVGRWKFQKNGDSYSLVYIP